MRPAAMTDETEKALFALRVLMAVIALTLGLGLAREDFARVAKQPRAVVVGMAAQTLLVPGLGFVVAWLFTLEAPLAVGLILLTACPGGVHSNLYNRLARGDVALSMTLTSVSTLVNMATLPLFVLLATRVFTGAGRVVTMDSESALLELGLLILGPLTAGMSLRASRPAIAARVERVMMVLSFTLLVLLIASSVAKNGALVASHATRVGLPVLALQFAAMTASYGIATAAGLPESQRITVGLEGGIQNATLAYVLSRALSDDLALGIPAIVYSLAIYFTAALFIPLGRLRIPSADPESLRTPGVEG